MTDHRILCGDSLHVLPTLDAESVDAIVCDPPYGLSFMGKEWDHGVPGEGFWREAWRVAKPGAHLVAFGGTRTYHRLACAIEDAGWEIRDCLSWLYGSGFPKSLDVSKAMDKHGGDPPSWFGSWFRKWREQNGITQKQVAALFPSKTGNLTGCVANWELGFNLPTPDQFNIIRDTFGLPFDSIHEAEREVVGKKTAGIANPDEGTRHTIGAGKAVVVDITAPATDVAKRWHGWGTALKPAWEPIILARKPLTGTVASNVAQYGTGALNVDGCRIGFASDADREKSHANGLGPVERFQSSKAIYEGGKRSAGFADTHNPSGRWPANVCLDEEAASLFPESRFFYTAKASRREREAGLEGMPIKTAAKLCDTGYESDTRFDGQPQPKAANHHPTVKPIALMRWLCRLVTPKGGLILDPFTGSGTTGCAAVLEGFRFVGIEREPEYAAIAEKRIAHWAGQMETPEPSLFDG